MNLSTNLWEANRDLANAALTHRFVRGIADGTLALVSFRAYVEQDAFFLESFARAYALALAHTSAGDDLRAFFELLAGVMEELDLHEDYARRWGTRLSGVEPEAATLAYTDFLLATAALQDIGQTCAAMTPCMRLYAHLGQALAEGEIQEDNPYAEWVETYSDPGFEALAARLESLLDNYAASPRIRATYRRAMQLEVGFFEAAALKGESYAGSET